MNDQLTMTARRRVREFVSFFAVIMCCISSDASFFRTRWPLFVRAAEPTMSSKR